VSAEWPTAADWLAGGGSGSAGTAVGERPHRNGSGGGDLVVAGVPLAEGAVTPSRYDLAPAAFRSALGRLSSFDGERQLDLSVVGVRDLGDDLVPPPLEAPLTVLLGGHNGVTFEALKGRDDLGAWGLLTLDAHHDVRPYRPGAPSNGSPVRALVDAGLPGTQIVQVGIAGFSNVAAHRRWCEEVGITIRGPGQVAEVPRILDWLSERCDSIYVDLDIDVLDRAFAPGCPGARPGGITPRELFEAAFAAGSHPAVRAVDIVEVDPETDLSLTTVFAGALAMLNIASGFSTRRGSARET
jgi:formiminoglutamase